MCSQRRLSSGPRAVASVSEADIAADLRELAFNSELEWLREVALVVLNGLKSFQPVGNQDDTKLNFKEQVAEFESRLILAALIRTGGNQRRAARELGIKVTTLNAKIKRHGIEVTSLAEKLRVEDFSNPAVKPSKSKLHFRNTSRKGR